MLRSSHSGRLIWNLFLLFSLVVLFQGSVFKIKLSMLSLVVQNHVDKLMGHSISSRITKRMTVATEWNK